MNVGTHNVNGDVCGSGVGAIPGLRATVDRDTAAAVGKGGRAGRGEREEKGLTERKRRETTEPASDCSPMVLTSLEGRRERICTTGVSVESCRNSESDVMRWRVSEERRRGRKGR